MLGFIILRHVNNRVSDLYWKECYTCIRKYYDNPILIIDDSSKKEYLTENIVLKNCTVIYDTEHKGCGELLPYYYFHRLKPFDTAIILHDSVFIQSPIDFTLQSNEHAKSLWAFRHTFDDEIFHIIDDICKVLPKYTELIELYHKKSMWPGCFGGMMVVRWDLVDKMVIQYDMFVRLLPKIKTREYRCGFERVLPLLVCLVEQQTISDCFGIIHDYMRIGTTFYEYLEGKLTDYPIVKVWSGR
jgi:hypothetical protein